MWSLVWYNQLCQFINLVYIKSISNTWLTIQSDEGQRMHFYFDTENKMQSFVFFVTVYGYHKLTWYFWNSCDTIKSYSLLKFLVVCSTRNSYKWTTIHCIHEHSSMDINKSRNVLSRLANIIHIILFKSKCSLSSLIPIIYKLRRATWYK